MTNDEKSSVGGGIFISEGNTLRIPGFTLTIDKKTGEVSITTAGKPQLHYDVTPVWLSIALDHLHNAKTAREQLLAAKESGEDFGQPLEREFRASMQAITSSAIAIDAFYGVLKSKLRSQPKEYDRQKKGSARHAQVSEVIKQAFQLKQRGVDLLRDAVDKIFVLRDRAVHPTGEFSDAVQHPKLLVGVEARQVTYSYESAFNVVQATVAYISELAAKGKAKNKALKEYASSLNSRVQKIRSDALLGLSPLT
jgi:hypothetical protein